MGGIMNHPQNHQLYGCYKPSLDGRYIFSLGEAHIHPLATGVPFFYNKNGGGGNQRKVLTRFKNENGALNTTLHLNQEKWEFPESRRN